MWYKPWLGRPGVLDAPCPRAGTRAGPAVGVCAARRYSPGWLAYAPHAPAPCDRLSTAAGYKGERRRSPPAAYTPGWPKDLILPSQNSPAPPARTVPRARRPPRPTAGHLQPCIESETDAAPGAWPAIVRASIHWPDQPRDLRSAPTRHFGQESPHDAPLLSAQFRRIVGSSIPGPAGCTPPHAHRSKNALPGCSPPTAFICSNVISSGSCILIVIHPKHA